MHVFFTTPYDGKIKYQTFIDEILAVLRERKVAVTTPEDGPKYKAVLQKFEQEGLKTERAHYAFISNGIADADLVIMEASYEDFRIGHEATLALLYSKPTLILSQRVDYSQYIPHELLFGKLYTSEKELREAAQQFLDRADEYLHKASETSQAIGTAADSLHIAALAASRQGALRDTSEFGNWARLAEKDPEEAYAQIQKVLGGLPVNEAWAVFAPIYNEDTPDYIFSGVANFVHSILKKDKIGFSDIVVDAATGTGALARNLVNIGYREVIAFDKSREMLAEAFHLCAHLPSIKLLEADIADVKLPVLAKAIAWADFSSNYALNPVMLRQWVGSLLQNIQPGGLLIFDVRTITGWQINFFHQKVTTFATPSFQRIWINLPDYDHSLITFDIFIRTRTYDGQWGEWQREQMTEHMWSMEDVRHTISSMPGCNIEAIYDDSFSLINGTNEPGLAYFLLRKNV